MLDPGVRTSVELLNSIDGVTTRASCEGEGSTRVHRHSTLAYVGFAYPLPPRFQEFLVSELGMIARVDDEAIYCRWPADNRHFLERLAAVTLGYKRRHCAALRESLTAPLSEIQSHLLARSADGSETVISACRTCPAFVVGPHGCRTALALVRWQATSAQIFRDFVDQPDNQLDPVLLATVGAEELEERTRRGDFGASFRGRWLRYHGKRTRSEMIAALRDGVRQQRRAGKDVDVLFDARYARVTWQRGRSRRLKA